MAVLAELNIDTFKPKSIIESEKVSEISTDKNTQTAEKIDHLAQIKSAIGLTRPATSSEPVIDSQTQPEISKVTSQPTSTQVELVNIHADDLAALTTWLQQTKLNYRHSQQTNQRITIEKLLFNQAIDNTFFKFDLTKAEDKKAFWQLVSQLLM